MPEPADFLANWHKRAAEQRAQFTKAVRARRPKDKVSVGLDALRKLEEIREELDDWLQQKRRKPGTLTTSARTQVLKLNEPLEELTTDTLACDMELGQLEEILDRKLTPRQTTHVTDAMVKVVRPVEKSSQELLDSVAETIEALSNVGRAAHLPRRTEVRADTYAPGERHAWGG